MIGQKNNVHLTLPKIVHLKFAYYTKFWKYYKGWHKESAIEGKINFYKRINETLSR